MNEHALVALARDGFVVVPGTRRTDDELLSFARRLGVPRASRPGRAVVRPLVPEPSERARPNTLTERYGRGAFPLHTEAAYWRTPPRYLVLACDDPGAAGRPTRVFDLRRLLNRYGGTLRRAVWAVDARPRFFANVVTGTPVESRFRVDLDCMVPADPVARAVASTLRGELQGAPTVSIDWEPGDVLVVDNHRVAHGRAQSSIPDGDRTLRRVLIE